MTSKNETYWVGSLNGQLVVYDPDVQIEGSSWIVLYFQLHEKYVPYVKSFARRMVKPISPHHDAYQSSIDDYLVWLQTKKTSKQSVARQDVIERDKKMSARIAKIKIKHKSHVKQKGCRYSGTSESLTANENRTTVCYSCRRTISSDLNLKCNACGWIVCSGCGVCGCGYDGINVPHDNY